MALSVLEPLRQLDPNVHITWVCGRTVAPLLRASGGVQEIIEVEEGNLLKGSLPRRLGTLFPLWFKLLGRSFDLILTGHSDPRYGLLSLTAVGKKRRRFQNKGERKMPLPGRFHGDEYVRLVTDKDGPEGIKARLPKLQLTLRSELKSRISRTEKPLVALAPGGSKNVLRDDQLRRWPVVHYRRLAEMLEKDGFQVLLTGSSSDQWVEEAFQGSGIDSLIGATDLLDLVALYGNCRLVVTHDSGPLHLAALAGAPCLALFGPTNPLEKVAAGTNVHYLWGGAELACRPCYDGKNYADCARNVCLEGLSIERVYEKAVQLLR